MRFLTIGRIAVGYGGRRQRIALLPVLHEGPTRHLLESWQVVGLQLDVQGEGNGLHSYQSCMRFLLVTYEIPDNW